MSESRHRTNSTLYQYNGKFVLRRRIDNSVITQFEHTGSIPGYEAITDETHPGYKRLNASTDIGGEMKLIREKMTSGPGGASTTLTSGGPTTGITEEYAGTLFPCDPAVMTYPNDPMLSRERMNEIGAEAIASLAPGNSTFDAWVAYAELYREGLPKGVADTVKQRSNVARQAGSNYLNIQFGWKPLVNDVLSLADTVTRAGDILKQLQRDAGRPVRRKSIVLQELSEPTRTVIGIGPPSVGGISYNPAGFGRWVLETQVQRTVTFSGSFCYYIPGNISSHNAIISGAAKANALFGIEITPSRLWNLTPWSWMADWFTNSKEVISNLERFSSGNLVMYYGYLTEVAIAENRYSYEPLYAASDSNAGSAPTVILQTKSINRVKANPYGFGITWDGLDPFQLSILTSLGITRK